MKSFFIKTFIGLSVISSFFYLNEIAALEGCLQDKRKISMVGDLDYIKHTLDGYYVPLEWKKQMLACDLEQSYQNAKAKILNTENITVKEFQKIIKQFLGSMYDYHLGASFISTEFATLPFSVKSVNGRYFVNAVDARSLSPSDYKIKVGDELIEFDGRPPSDAITELLEALGRYNKNPTDQSLAETSLTYRSGMKGDDVPQGPILVKFNSKEEGVYSYQLVWNYHPEMITSPADHLPLLTKSLSDLFKFFEKPKIECKLKMIAFEQELYNKCDPKLAKVGAIKSFLPTLGELVWQPEEKLFFSPCIYKNEAGYAIGYIRIPHYAIGLEELRLFEEIIDYLQLHTDALVIDQVQNPGGLVSYVYALASRLTNFPLATPQHRLKINQWTVLNAYNDLENLETIQSDAEAKEVLEEFHPLPTLQYVLFIKEYCRFIIKEWNLGKTFTDPTYLEGADYLNPHSTHRYTKPILILIDELDFSGGDFFPAIMQDNKRATLFGAKTAGAGGAVSEVFFPERNQHGILGFKYTISLAARPNQQAIENFGVKPDIEYQITEEDLQTNYQPYIKAVNQAVQKLLQAEPSSQ